ncbi:MAG TPA: hypothetical protein VL027_09275 [Spongiibacteraceae bacterium]|nr:hypothetical protein [Spongiibacteraceae bacterium]
MIRHFVTPLERISAAVARAAAPQADVPFSGREVLRCAGFSVPDLSTDSVDNLVDKVFDFDVDPDRLGGLANRSKIKHCYKNLFYQ